MAAGSLAPADEKEKREVGLALVYLNPALLSVGVLAWLLPWFVPIEPATAPAICLVLLMGILVALVAWGVALVQLVHGIRKLAQLDRSGGTTSCRRCGRSRRISSGGSSCPRGTS
jgi:hypothetical protein